MHKAFLFFKLAIGWMFSLISIIQIWTLGRAAQWLDWASSEWDDQSEAGTGQHGREGGLPVLRKGQGYSGTDLQGVLMQLVQQPVLHTHRHNSVWINCNMSSDHFKSLWYTIQISGGMLHRQHLQPSLLTETLTNTLKEFSEYGCLEMKKINGLEKKIFIQEKKWIRPNLLKLVNFEMCGS